MFGPKFENTLLICLSLSDVVQVESCGGGDNPLPGAHPGDGGAGNKVLIFMIPRITIGYLNSDLRLTS